MRSQFGIIYNNYLLFNFDVTHKTIDLKFIKAHSLLNI